MEQKDRFLRYGAGLLVGFIVGAVVRDVSWVSAAVGFLAVWVWQLRQDGDRREKALRDELQDLRRLLVTLASPESKPEHGTAPAQPPSTQPPEATRPPDSKPVPAPRQPEVIAPPAGAIPRATPAAPPAPSALETALGAAMRFFTTGNVIAKLGVIMLFLGVAFLAKYVGDRVFFPIEARMGGAAAGAFLLNALGWRLRANRQFGLILQGGGIGIFYLTVFASFRLYDLVPAEMAFGLLFATTAFSAILAILQNAPTLAIFGVSGGFLAPILTSTGSGSHVALFSYYSLLNLGIFAIGWFKSWRLLNVVGFVFTFVIGGVWGTKYYQPEHFDTVEPFLIGFFALYVAIVFLFSRRDTTVNGVDAGLLFGAPVVAFALQAGLVADTKYGLAFSALGFGAFYVLSAYWLYRAKGRNPYLAQSYLGMGAAFLTLTVPLAFDGKWTAAVWAPEGAAVLWTGFLQRRKLVQVSGGVLLFLAAVAFVSAADRTGDMLPFANAFYMGYIVLALAYLAAAVTLHREEKRWHPLPAGLALLSAGWALTGGMLELEAVAPRWWQALTGAPITLGHAQAMSVHAHATFLYASAATVLYSAAGRWLRWPFVERFRRGLLPLVGVGLLPAYLPLALHPFTDLGLITWSMAFAVHYMLLHHAMRHRGAVFEPEQHFLPLYLATVVLGWELAWQVMHELDSATWAAFAAPMPMAAIFYSVTAYRGPRWPLEPFREAYLSRGLLPLSSAALLYVFYLASFEGNPAPLAFVPLFNPIDLMSVGLMITCIFWWRATRLERCAQAIGKTEFSAVLGAVAFAWLTAAVVRTVHVYSEIRWDFPVLMDSTRVHAALSVTWSLVALVSMIWATRKGQRKVWLVGSSLLGLVALKLLIFDMAATGTIERVVSFLGTGALWLGVGYFAPLPPRRPTEPERDFHA